MALFARAGMLIWLPLAKEKKILLQHNSVIRAQSSEWLMQGARELNLLFMAALIVN